MNSRLAFPTALICPPRRIMLGALLALASLAGCGQPGDLYMPKPAHTPAPKASSPAPAPQQAVAAPASSLPASSSPAVK
ncbi:MAG: lipoprotein [Massilia sp.]